jgi:hypothetical protein
MPGRQLIVQPVQAFQGDPCTVDCGGHQHRLSKVGLCQNLDATRNPK